jgi:hypothetical protein
VPIAGTTRRTRKTTDPKEAASTALTRAAHAWRRAGAAQAQARAILDLGDQLAPRLERQNPIEVAE